MTRPTRSACHPFAVLAIASALALAGCGLATTQPGGTMTSTRAPKPFDGTRPAKDVFTDFLDTIDDTIQHSGTTFPKWNRKDVTGYNAVACGIKSREDGNQYYTNLEGGPVDDPDQAIQDIKARWEAKGYAIGNIFTNMGGNTTARQINATTPSGVFVQFIPGKTRSSVEVKSDCTLDPLAKEATTDTIPLGGTGTSAQGE
ncbi:hypothetical protein [Arthrobacter sp. 2MCAF14]|uniref:hypothetical protein n=1 Tax=Arthrobacter sp. 2MCAF14 TaxID=3232982 RepID=UPI003F8DB60A